MRLRFFRHSAAITLAAALAACGSSPRLASGPIDLTNQPVEVRFEQSVSTTGEGWELCFEFDKPRDSHKAGSIHATLVTADGVKVPFRVEDLDRRGEARVCQIGVLEYVRSDSSAVVFESAELYSDVPVRIHGLRGGSRE